MQQDEVRRLYEAQGAIGATAMTMPRAAAANDSPSPEADAVPAAQAAMPAQADGAAVPVGEASLANANLASLPVAQAANAPDNEPGDDDDEPVFRISGASLGLR